VEIRDFDTPAKNTWCPGCNNFSILSAVKQAFADLVNSGEVKPEELVMLSGVGVSWKNLRLYQNQQLLLSSRKDAPACDRDQNSKSKA
jgi:pyruvate/2-oxoacid:ferredoxin oxidoreductase beta subunit